MDPEGEHDLHFIIELYYEHDGDKFFIRFGLNIEQIIDGLSKDDDPYQILQDEIYNILIDKISEFKRKIDIGCSDPHLENFPNYFVQRLMSKFNEQ